MMDNFAIPILALLVIILALIHLVFLFDQSIITNEAFKVTTSDTSKYSCIVSEVENELLLNCLKIK